MLPPFPTNIRHLSASQRLYRNIDVQKVCFAIINRPNSELYGASVCIMHYFDQSARTQLDNVFLIVGCGFLQILIPNTGFYGEKQGPMGYLFTKKKKSSKKNLHNYFNIDTPYSIRLTHGDGGGVLPSRLSKKYAKMASSRQLFWLVDLPLDVYVSIYIVFGAASTISN